MPMESVNLHPRYNYHEHDRIFITKQKIEKSVVYNDFLRRYNIASNKLFGFVEGIEDPCFYRSAIQHLIPSEFDVDFWPVGNKDKLQKLYALFDWELFHATGLHFLWTVTSPNF